MKRRKKGRARNPARLQAILAAEGRSWTWAEVAQSQARAELVYSLVTAKKKP